MYLLGCAAGFKTLPKHFRVSVRAGAVVVLLGLTPSSTVAQILDHFNPLNSNANGVHLSGASISGMYSRGSASGLGLGLPVEPNVSDNKPLTMLQGSATFALNRTIQKSSLTINYSPSFVRGISGSTFESTNHALVVSVGRALGTKWSISGSINGILSDYDQLLFGGNRYAGTAMTPATFDELAAAILTGRSTNLPLTQTLNTAPAITTPETAFLYGGRVLSVAAMGSLTYAYSTRSSLSMSVSTMRTQFFDRGNNEFGTRNRGSVPWTTSASPNLTWGYSLTPRTTISANLSTARTVSQYQDAYANQAGMTIGRTMSSRWFLNGTLGVGWIKPLRQTIEVTRRPQVIYGGGVGYKLYAHTFIASFTRTVADAYGFGANSTEASTGAWAWKRPGSSVSLTTSFGYSRLANPLIPNTRSWTGMVSVGKALTSQLVISASYSYVRLPSGVVSSVNDLTRSGTVVSLSWSPSARR